MKLAQATDGDLTFITLWYGTMVFALVDSMVLSGCLFNQFANLDMS